MRLYFRKLVLGCVLLLSACSEEPTTAPASGPEFAGSAACADCHAPQYSDWTNSHHDLAMQVADDSTVLGDFRQATFEYFGTSTQFLKHDSQFIVRTANAAGEIEDFQITHTFGVIPLQQYLVEFPGGRLQALPFAWDSRESADGGQRWFHLYPDEDITPGDELHWTGRQANWNYMCAECHSTDLQVNYDPETDSFATSWAEIDVGCESCHGPASTHVAQARSDDFSRSKGLQLDLDDHGRAVWQMNLQTGIAERSELAMRQPRQPEACGRCHARRGVITDSYEYGKPLLDTHRVSLLDAPLYFDDGQIRGEVYVYGSFVQSRMYGAGVTCSDCHNPHSLDLVTGSESSDVCTQCHLPQKFSSTEHHRHELDDVTCVDCHMPARDYMVVDPRRDHSFRIPRPDLSVTGEMPNACNNCHTERDAEWATAAAQNWWGKAESRFAQTGIVRATALSRLPGPLDQATAASVQQGLTDADPLVRSGALRAARLLSPDAQLQLAAPLLKDSIRSVRIEAALLLSPRHEYLSSASGFAAAAEEFRAAQAAIASRPEAQVALGEFALAMGNPDLAIEHYSTALGMDPAYLLSRLNFADALRRSGDEQGAETLLREGLALNSDIPEIHHALGLLLVRTERSDEGLVELREASQLAPDNPRFVYVLGIALNSLGQADEALALLELAHSRFSRDFDIAWALATMLRDSGDQSGALLIANELALQRPGDPNIDALLESLRAP